MYMTCRHIKVNGLRCESPALKGTQFCYYHTNLRAIEVDLKFGPLLLPPPEDPGAIQLSVARINEAILLGRIELRKAATLFNGLRIAAQFIDRTQFSDPEETVQSSEMNSDGSQIAPRYYVCDDDEQCSDCPYTELCPRCIHPGDKDADSEDD